MRGVMNRAPYLVGPILPGEARSCVPPTGTITAPGRSETPSEMGHFHVRGMPVLSLLGPVSV